MVKIVDIPESLKLTPDYYADDVAAVDDAGAAGVLTFPADELKAHVSRLHSSARSLGRSVRIVDKAEDEDEGTVDVTFVVVDRITRPRTKANEPTA